MATRLPLNCCGDDGAGDAALLVVAPADPEHVPHVASVTFGLVAAGVITTMPFSW